MEFRTQGPTQPRNKSGSLNSDGPLVEFELKTFQFQAQRLHELFQIALATKKVMPSNKENQWVMI